MTENNPRIPRSIVAREKQQAVEEARQRYEAAMARKLVIADLEPGDIIATASTGKGSEGIRWSLNSPFSHTILYRGSGIAVDAMPDVGVSTDRLWRKLEGSSAAAVFRHRIASREQRELAVQWAVKQADKPYDHSGAVRTGLRPGARGYLARTGLLGLTLIVADESAANGLAFGHDASFFCSELVFRAYEVAGAPLVDTPAHLVGPDKLLETDVLELSGSLNTVG